MKKLLVSLFAVVMLFGCAGMKLGGVDYTGNCKTTILKYEPQGNGVSVIVNQNELDYPAIQQIEDFINGNEAREDGHIVEATHFAWSWDNEFKTGSAVLLLSDPDAVDGWVECEPNYGYIVMLDEHTQLGDFDAVMSDMTAWTPMMILNQDIVNKYLEDWK
jgi:hypothetical protein